MNSLTKVHSLVVAKLATLLIPTAIWISQFLFLLCTHG